MVNYPTYLLYRNQLQPSLTIHTAKWCFCYLWLAHSQSQSFMANYKHKCVVFQLADHELIWWTKWHEYFFIMSVINKHHNNQSLQCHSVSLGTAIEYWFKYGGKSYLRNQHQVVVPNRRQPGVSTTDFNKTKLDIRFTSNAVENIQRRRVDICWSEAWIMFI